jgi:hypothetical protein
MPEDIIIGLRTLELVAVSPKFVDTPERAFKRRVFTDDEWRYLNSRPTAELHARIALGSRLISLMYRPELLNMDQRQAAQLSSNLRYQQDAIREIIKARNEVNDGSR